MTPLESSGRSSARGGASAFAVAIALDRPPWQAGFAAVAAVLVGSWTSPLVTGAVIAGIAWCCVTGFDVRHFGEIRVTGRDDALRTATLILAGLLAAAAHALAEARGRQRVGPLWPSSTEPAPYARTASSPTEQRKPRASPGRRARAARPRPSGRFRAHRTEEPSDGRPGIHPADSRDLRPARPGREGGGTAVSRDVASPREEGS